MNVRVLLFGPAAAAAGADSVTVSGVEAGTCEQVITALGGQFPALRPFTIGGRLAVNSNYADAATRVAATDEVALISLVSGG
jgi:molybdopterin converting factor small subunit